MRKPSKQTTHKPKTKRTVSEGRIYVRSSFNNTIVTVTDLQGNALCWASGGTNGFSGSRKGTPFSAQMAAQSAARRAMDQFGMHRATVFVKGPGSGRETAIRALQAAGMDVRAVRDCTPVPHNGCRPKKRRRV